MMRRPQINVDSVQHSEQREAPGDTLDDGAVAILSELVNNRAEQEEVNDGPGKSADQPEVPDRTTNVPHQMRNAQGAGVMYVSLPV